jgi:K+-transporting ATPase ATPase A chain
VQTFKPYATVAVVQPTEYDEPVTDKDGKPVLDDKGQPKTKKSNLTEQVLAVGPAASQIAIKQLGTNGGGFFNVNSAHPFENATPLSNFLELLAILVISGALCYTFGVMVGDTRQGWAVLAAMTVIFVVLLVVCAAAEQNAHTLVKQGVDHTASALSSGGNMEGKEVRFGIASSALWATATTSASNGSVNSMHDSFSPIGGLVPMWLMQLGEVVYGGVGSGLYGMIVFAIIAVFVAGLMVGRTPEYLGKKIEAYEMKMASLVILIPPAVVLIGAAVGVVSPGGKATIFNPGAHGFSEVLYAFSSAGNNNGSAFAGLGANTPFYNTALGFAMLIARYWLAIPTLAIAGALARKKTVPAGPGTLPTHTPLFVGLLIGVVVLVGALTFVPALALGPIVEHLMLVAAK